ncbi:MAG: Asp23/Gls24 family envelope stress response protein [Gaiella sp.]
MSKGGLHVARQTELGTVAVSTATVAAIVAGALAESYGVVGIPRRRFPRLRRGRGTDGIAVRATDHGLDIVVQLVVEYGLKLTEVAAVVRERVTYDVERQTGLTVAAVDVRIEDARRS